MTAFTFFIALILFILIGFVSSQKAKKTNNDFLLASRNSKPWMVALSAVATNNSGYMFIAMIGYAYTNGISVFWIMICAIIGDFTASIFVHKKLRIESGKYHTLTFSETISKWSGQDHKKVRIISALIITIFLTIYASAQLKAGGKAMSVIFEINQIYGVLIGGFIVLIYCSIGGIRASIWINTIQAIIMIVSMAILFFAAIHQIGGFTIFFEKIFNISAEFSSVLPPDLLFNPALGLVFFIIGWFFGGYGIIGQPHIMTSFMTLSNADEIKKIRIFYYSWYIIFFTLTISTGLAARILIPLNANFDAELALPTLSFMLLDEILIGFILAGIFSATLSTADSQILASSAAINNDLNLFKKLDYRYAKLITAAIAFASILIAAIDSQSVFSLVMIAWLALACSFSQIITIYAMGFKISEKLAISMMLTGFLTMLIWRYFDLGKSVYEAAPAIIAGFIPFLIYKLSKKRDLII